MLVTAVPAWAAELPETEVMTAEEEQQTYRIDCQPYVSYTADDIGDSLSYGSSTIGAWACMEEGVDAGTPGAMHSLRLNEGVEDLLRARVIEVRADGLDVTEEQKAELLDVALHGGRFTFEMPENDVEFKVVAYFDSEIQLGSQVTGGSIEIDNEYPITGEHVSIRAVADEGYRFVQWKSIGSRSWNMDLASELDRAVTEAENGFVLPRLLRSEHNWRKPVVQVVPEFEEIQDTSFSVTFQTEEGSGENPPALQQVKGDTISLPDNPYTFEGHDFLGWSDGDNIYQPGDSYTMPHKSVVFTAQWRSSALRDVWFKAEEDTAPQSLGIDARPEGDTFALPENTFKHSGELGYDFAGWSDGEHTYQPGDTYTIGPEDVVFTAQWKRYYKFTVDQTNEKWRARSELFLLPQDNQVLRKLKNENRAPVEPVENLTWGMTYFNQPEFYHEFAGITINGINYTKDTVLESTDYFSGTVKIHITGSDVPNEEGYAYGYVEFLNGEFREDVKLFGNFEKQPFKTNTAQINEFSVGDAKGSIEENEILVRLGDEADLTKVTPDIKISDGAAVVPDSGREQDFTDPVIYTVTSKNGKVSRSYKVTVVKLRDAITEAMPSQIIQGIASNKDSSGNILGKNLSQVSSTNTDWVAFGMGRYGYVQPDGSVQMLYEDEEGREAFLEAMKAYMEKMYAENDGVLSKDKATEWQRAILAIAALGGDPTNFGTYNGKPIDLVADGTYNCKIEPGKQGVNGEAFALLAKNTLDYEIPDSVQYSDEYLITSILSKQLRVDGRYVGWDVRPTATASDPDMTGMIIQALSPYYWDDTEYTYDNVKTGESRTVTVRQVVDEALDALGELQTEYGDYICYGDRNVESTVQVLVAITSLGIDPLTDERFIKNGNTLIDGIQSFSLSGGGYEHMLGGGWNYMATDQGNYGMVAAWRYFNGMRSLYDMRPEFTDEQKAQIQSVKDTIDAALEKEGGDDYYEALAAAKQTYDDAVAGFEDPTLRSYITNYWELMDAIPDEEDRAAEVIQKIDAIGTVTLESEAAIKEAREAYDALTEEEQALVTNSQTLADAEKALADLQKEQQEKLEQEAKAVKDMIASLDTVTLKDEAAVLKARDAYERLSPQAKELVDNYGVLTDAEAAVQSLKAEQNAFVSGKPSVKTQSLGINNLKVSWNSYENADSYEVYRKAAGKTFQKIATVKGLTYTDKTAVTGNTYYYAVKAVSGKWGSTVYSDYVTNVTGKVLPARAKITNAQSLGYNKAKITWDKVSGATGYRLYYKITAKGTWKYVTEIKNGNTTSYVQSGLTSGRDYYYVVRAYRTVNGTKYFGADSEVRSVRPVPWIVKISKVTAGTGQAKVTWGKIPGATGYSLYHKTSKNGAWQYAAHIGNGSTTSYTDKGLKKGQTVYYRMRAYRKVSGKQVFGGYSAEKSVKIK